jgi:hypothetical protein
MTALDAIVIPLALWGAYMVLWPKSWRCLFGHRWNGWQISVKPLCLCRDCDRCGVVEWKYRDEGIKSDRI